MELRRGLLLAVLVALTSGQIPPRPNIAISGVPCTQSDISNMIGKCMIKFSRGHGPAVMVKMRKSLQCETSMINCTAVMETRVCLANLGPQELSSPCRPYIDTVSDHQFGLFNLPCHVRHLKSHCMDLFIKNGLTQF
uniref:FZ domain-containing protein n=1 Tax=Biomphalaria glabrata TaxID=6526 RepID=A0A2C9KG20_BIOGL